MDFVSYRKLSLGGTEAELIDVLKKKSVAQENF